MKKIIGVLLFLLFSILAYVFYYIFIDIMFPYLIKNYSLFIGRNFKLSTYSHYVEPLVLSFLFIVVLSLSKRPIFSFIITLFLYIGFIFLNVIKIKYLYSPILPTDLLQLKELMQSKDFFLSILPQLMISLLIFISIFIFVFKYDKTQTLLKFASKYNFIFVISLTIILLIFNNAIKQNLRENGIFYKKNSNLVIHYLTKGFLTSYLQILFYSDKYQEPVNYTEEKIEKIVLKYNLNAKTQTSNDPVNLIVFMVEALTFPNDMGWKTTSPVLSSFSDNNQSKGVVYTPIIGGKSINAEFELLTGFTNRFTIPESLVYREGIKRNIPSLARTLKQFGYRTIALRDEPVDTYGFKKIYNFLGFDKALSFVDMKLNPDPSEKHTSSIDVANKIIEISKKSSPSFIFTFTMSSHAPWNGKDYNSELDFIYPNNINDNVKNEMKGYLNSIQHMDIAIKRLKDYFKTIDEKTAILIVGDHQPHLNVYRDHNYQIMKSQFKDNELAHYIANHQLSAILWKNFDDKSNEFEISMNFLPALLLDVLKIKTCGILKFNKILQQNTNVLTKYIKTDNGFQLNFDEKNMAIINDYELLQYDVIYGENYISKYLDDHCL
ncbi:hypothetical protein MNBD_GAMMA03-11 [hydrothermal vent metagenome]|uniref:Sulfatase N-terminal domain-containing protein n=1 Tax=hydrothermal vent metagenome TaxID=652676 RepID=A0A3B0WY16_9ZZZZ